MIEVRPADGGGWETFESLAEAAAAHPCPMDAPDGKAMFVAREKGSGRPLGQLVRRGLFGWRWEP